MPPVVTLLCLLFMVVVPCAATLYALGYFSRDKSFEKLQNEVGKLKAELTSAEALNKVYDDNAKSYIEKMSDLMLENARCKEGNRVMLRNLNAAWDEVAEEKRKYVAFVDSVRSDTLKFPVVLELIDNLQKKSDEKEVDLMEEKAPKSAERVAEARRQARALFRENVVLKSRVQMYQNFYPELEDYMDCTVDEMVQIMQEEDEFKRERDAQGDAVGMYLLKEEYEKLSDVERNQLALDRYWKRVPKSLWCIGVQYERYIGYLYEMDGYRVKYHGALKKKEDLGIDLIATKGKTVLVIQCKRYSEVKKLPVRENCVCQIFGAAKFYKESAKVKGQVIPVIVTSYELSEEARCFARALKVKVREHEAFKFGYPCIKCNIGKGGEKIFHLPFDAMYDATIIEPEKGEFYAATVQEAYLHGFRRAFKWLGKGESA